MKQDLGPLGTIDLLTDKELRESLGHHFTAQIREWYRGIDYLGFSGQGNGTSTLIIPGPQQGYTWNLKIASAQLSAAGVLSVYPGDNNTVAPIGVVTAITNFVNNDAVITWSSNQAVIKDGRNITFAASQIINTFRLMVQQVPTEMQGKL